MHPPPKVCYSTPMIGIDKIYHFIGSFILTFIDPYFAAAVGIGKEIWDALGNGTAELADLVADGLGILFALQFM